jgi:hypothetical protein
MYASWKPAVLGMLRHITADTFHPIVFMVSPMPGGPDSQPTGGDRYRSKMHHTTGFPTREEAVANLTELSGQVKEHLTPGLQPRVLKSLADPSCDYEWDGDGIPAMVPFIADSELMDVCPVCKGKSCDVRKLEDCPRCHGLGATID